jgi:hypothetical protein
MRPPIGPAHNPWIKLLYSDAVRMGHGDMMVLTDNSGWNSGMDGIAPTMVDLRKESTGTLVQSSQTTSMRNSIT